MRRKSVMSKLRQEEVALKNNLIDSKIEESVNRLVYYYFQELPEDLELLESNFAETVLTFKSRKFGKLIIRLSQDRSKLSTYLKNQWARNRAAERGVPIAHCLLINDSVIPYVYMIETVAEGIPANEFWGDNRTLWHEIGAIATRINSIRGFIYGSVLDLPADKCLQYKTWTENISHELNWIFKSNFWTKNNPFSFNEQQYIIERLNGLRQWQFNPGMVHNDLLLKNIVLNEKGKVSAILGWNSARFVRVPYGQLASTFSWLGKTEREAFLQGYGMSINEFKEMEYEIDSLSTLNHLGELVELKQQYKEEYLPDLVDKVKNILEKVYVKVI